MKHINEVMKNRLNMSLKRKETCGNCENEIEVYEAAIIGGPNKGETTEFKYGCKCEDLTLARQALEQRKRLKEQKLRTYFDRYSLINHELQLATLEKYSPQNESQAHALQLARHYVETFQKNDPFNLVFFGRYGAGKSHLAKSIADEIVKKGFTSIFISMPKLLRKLRSTFHRESDITEDEMMRIIEEVDLLVLDDISVAKTEWGEEKLFDIIDSRQGLHTIYTTNDSPRGFLEHIGEREFSRIIKDERSIVEIEGENYRLKDFKKGGKA